MEPLRKYQKTNEDNLQTTAQNARGGQAAETETNPRVVQIFQSNLSQETKDLLTKISKLNNVWDIIPLIRGLYKGDGKDFNLYYATIAQKISASKRTDINIYCCVKDSIDHRQMHNGFQKTPEEIKNNAYYSLASDASIDTQDRLRFACEITDTAKQIEAFKSILKVSKTYKRENLKNYIHLVAKIFKIEKSSKETEQLQLKSIVHGFIEKIFQIDGIENEIDILLSLQYYQNSPLEKISYYCRMARIQGMAIHYFLEIITLAKKTLESIPDKAEAKNASDHIDRLCFNRFLNSQSDDSLNKGLYLLATPNNRIILDNASNVDKKHQFLIKQASCQELTLLYRLHLCLFTDCKETLTTIFTKIVKDTSVDWKRSNEALSQIMQVRGLNTTLWNESFAGIARDTRLSTTARLNAARLINEYSVFDDLIPVLQADATMNQEISYYSFLMDTGYEIFACDFLSEDPDVVSLEAFNALCKQKASCIEAALKTYNARETSIDEALKSTTNKDAIESLTRDKEKNAKSRNWVLQIAETIQAIYPLYKIVLEKSLQPYSITQAIADLKLDQEEYLNENAYLLPSLLDPVWQDDFDKFDFDFFINSITAVKDACVALCKNRQAKQEDINLYTNSYQEWLSILNNKKYPVIKNLLRISATASNSHVLQLNTIVSEIERALQLSRCDKIFTALNTLILNTQTCPGGQLEAIENSYIEIAYSNINRKNSTELALETVLNCLYTIRYNWVSENNVKYTEKGKYVAYTPLGEDGSFIADSPFMNELEQLLNREELMDAFSCDAAALADYAFLTGRNKVADEYGRTHITEYILGISAIVLGLRSPNSAPALDDNIEAESWFLKNSASDKATIIKAFVKSFTFENIWQGLAKLLWQKTAEISTLEMDLYTDLACMQAISLEDDRFISKEDPLGKGPCRFLETLGLKSQDCCEQMKVYYKLEEEEEEEESYEAVINTNFSKEGVRAILSKFNILSATTSV